MVNFLGDLTYPVYLTHGFLLLYYWRTPFTAWLDPQTLLKIVGGYLHNPLAIALAVAAIVIACALLVAVVVHFVVEIPTATILRKLVDLGARVRFRPNDDPVEAP